MTPDVQLKVFPSCLFVLESGLVRTDADGSFVTPAQLLSGSSYRIIIRPDGGPLVTSDWLKAASGRTTFPPFRLKQRRKLLGLVQDRRGKPVAGARVFLPSGEPSTMTDAQGQYLLEGVLPDKTFVLVKADGFRFERLRPVVPTTSYQSGDAHPRTVSRQRAGLIRKPGRPSPPRPRPSARSHRRLPRALVAGGAGQRR